MHKVSLHIDFTRAVHRPSTQKTLGELEDSH